MIDTGRERHGAGATRVSARPKSLGRVKGDRLLLRDDGQPYAVKQMRTLIAQAQVEAGLEETGNMHICDTPSAPASR